LTHVHSCDRAFFSLGARWGEASRRARLFMFAGGVVGCVKISMLPRGNFPSPVSRLDRMLLATKCDAATRQRWLACCNIKACDQWFSCRALLSLAVERPIASQSLV
jgi:hypothetical protein